ncbi:MAG: hypothetical protein ACM30I_08540 [Gemmatimonas sp.]
MRWAILSAAFVAGALAVPAPITAAETTTVLAGTEWGSAPGCRVEVVRFHPDGTAHVLYDAVYDFVDADEATWRQQGNALVLTVDGEEYRGRVAGGTLRLSRILAPAASGTCAFQPSRATSG